MGSRRSGSCWGSVRGTSRGEAGILIGSTVIVRDGPGSEPDVSVRRVAVGWGDIVEASWLTANSLRDGQSALDARRAA
ncbi:MAG TPA: hypothetical protein VMF14_17375 [Solirubrobacteraceae bacterium]|nr:hypothetical protein [Solirubrobacteraceae bacterium]